MSDKSSNIVDFPFDVENILRLLQADARNQPVEKEDKDLPEIAVRITIVEGPQGAELVLHRMEKTPADKQFVLTDRRSATRINLTEADALWRALMDIFKTGNNWKLIWDSVDETR